MPFKFKVKTGSGTPALGVLDTGEFGYDTQNERLFIGNGPADFATAIGGELMTERIYNGTGSQLNKLDAVYINGAQGQRITVALARANTEGTSSKTLGLIAANLANGDEGEVAVSGLLRGVNASGSQFSETWNQGDAIYLSPSAAGSLTKVKPVAPNHMVLIGFVVNNSSTSGSIFVKVQNGFELHEIHDVLISSPNAGHTLIYDNINLIWKNATITAGNAITITNGAGSISIAHSDTSSQNSVDNSGVDYIQDVTLDTYGHVTGLTSATIRDASASQSGLVSTGTQTFAGAKTINGSLTINDGTHTMFIDGNEIYHSATDSSFFIKSLGDIYFQPNNSTAVVMTEGGNVGIGTTAPTHLLHVAGSNGILTTIAGASSSVQIGADGNGGVIRPQTVDRLNFTQANGTNVMTINGANVGIGTTAPAVKLHVSGGTRIVGVLSVMGDAETKRIGVDYDDTLDAGSIFAIHDGTAYKNLILNRDGGNVGIGVGSTAPTATLQVKSDNITKVPLIVDTLASHTTDIVSFRNNGSAQSRILSDGSFVNGSSVNNAQIKLTTTGTEILRNIADSNVTMKVNQVHASSTGDIAQFQFGGVTKASINKDGGITAVDLTLSGNLTVNGTTTNINTTNLVVEDKNIVLGDVTTPSDVTADGGGITLKGSTDKTITWVDSTDSWTSNQVFSAPNFTSTVATGTQPYAAISTTLNTNLNADLLDGQHAAAFVDLTSAQTITGTKTFTDLIVGGGSSSNWELDGTLSSVFYLKDASETARLTVLDTGNVGIGETSPTAQLHVESGSTTRVPLIIDTLSSHTANLSEWKVNGSNLATLTSAGFFRGAGLLNLTTGSNSRIDVGNNGSVIQRDIADANPSLVVNQVNASSTGNIANFQFAGANKLEITKDGFLTQNGSKLLHQIGGTTNIFLGNQVAELNSTGTLNTALGQLALYSNTTSSNNTALGYASMSLTTGANNTSVGSEAGRGITSGTNNTFIGRGAGYTSQLSSASNSTAIGNGSYTDASNQMVFGNASVADFKFNRNTSAVINAPQIISSSSNALTLERTSTNTNSTVYPFLIKATSTGDMVDGFGSRILFQIRDNANTDNNIGFIGLDRSGADNSARVVFGTNNAGTLTEKMTIMPDGKVGIGTSAPQNLLSLVTLSNTEGIQVRRNSNTTNDYALLGFRINSTEGVDYGQIRSVRTNRAVGGDTDLSFFTFSNGSLGQRLVIRDDGNLGIGITNPTVKLDVSGTVRATSISTESAGNGAGETISFTDGQGVRISASGTERMRITEAGNVGIGTTNPSRAFEVVSNNEIATFTTHIDTAAVGANIFLRRSRGTASSPTAILSSDVIGGFFSQGYHGTDFGSNTGAIRFLATQNFTSGAQGTAIDFATTPNNSTSRSVRMFINENGNVGIGTTAPSELLHVAGDIQIDGTGSTIAGATLANGALKIGTTLAMDSNEFYYGTDGFIGTVGNFSLIFNLNAAERVRFLPNGRVGIGTASPDQLLHVAGAINLHSQITWFNGNADINGADTNLKFRTYTGSALTEKMRITAAGNVGIGTETPGYKLDIQAATDTLDGIRLNRTGGTYPTNWLLYSRGDNTDLRLFTTIGGNKDVITFETDGKVGIGNSTPTELLDVTGTVKSTALNIDGLSIQDTSTVTTTSTAQTALASFAAASYGTGKFLIQATQGTARQVSEILVVHNGTTAEATEYAVIKTGSTLFTTEVDINSGNVRVLITSTSATSTVYKAAYTLIGA